MYAGKLFSPSDPAEDEVYTFDFKNDLAAGETLTTSVIFSCTVSSGTDDQANTRPVGSPQVQGGTQVLQRIANLQPNVTYLLKAVVETTQGNTKALHSFVSCRLATGWHPYGVT